LIKIGVFHSSSTCRTHARARAHARTHTHTCRY